MTQDGGRFAQALESLSARIATELRERPASKQRHGPDGGGGGRDASRPNGERGAAGAAAGGGAVGGGAAASVAASPPSSPQRPPVLVLPAEERGSAGPSDEEVSASRARVLAALTRQGCP